MKTQPVTSGPSTSSHLLEARFLAALLLTLLLVPNISVAGSATWSAAPATGDWNTATNWSPASVPNGPSDTASFATSNITSVSLSAAIEVNAIVFNPGAGAYTINANTPTSPATALTISGAGITNNSGVTQNVVAMYDPSLNSSGSIVFKNSAKAGASTVFTIDGGDIGFASLLTFSNSSSGDHAAFIINSFAFAGFVDSSTADHSTWTINGTDPITLLDPGELDFTGTATAANAAITANGGTARGFAGGLIGFSGSATAGDAIVTANGGTNKGNGSKIVFSVSGSAGNSTLIANTGTTGGTGGVILFQSDSTGGTARVEIFGKGQLDISLHSDPGVTIGSLEGSGTALLGARNLTIGSSNLTTSFTGTIQDGGIGGGAGGSLTKIGTGSLTLKKQSTYTGVTTVSAGTLLASNITGSATGTGAITVNGGVLGGTGTVTGGLTIATTTTAATLSPGAVGKVGTLTTLGSAFFQSQATYEIDVNSKNVSADQLVANGVTVRNGALVSLRSTGNNVLTQGTVFTVINNTSASVISGNFNNLRDGSTVTVGNNNYQVSYSGGTGNDLTLTVVP